MRIEEEINKTAGIGIPHLIRVGLKQQFLSKKKALKIMNIAKYRQLTCELCGKPINPKSKGKNAGLTIDHIIPKSRGGSDHISNMQLAHKICNTLKNNAMPKLPKNPNIEKYQQKALTGTRINVIV